MHNQCQTDPYRPDNGTDSFLSWQTTGFNMATEGKSTLLRDIGKTIMLLAGVFFVVWVVVFVALSISTNNI
jgi:hypothetical protein